MRPPRPQRQLVILVVLATVAIAVAAGLWRHARGATSAPTASWLVLASNRDGGEYTLGEGQTYAMRPSGSRLTSLLGTESRLTPVAVSANGRAVAYQNANTMGAVYVSRSDGTGLAR